jgi:hypothetical protein
MTWCEANNVGFILGLATNARLETAIACHLAANLAFARRDNEPCAT